MVASKTFLKCAIIFFINVIRTNTKYLIGQFIRKFENYPAIGISLQAIIYYESFLSVLHVVHQLMYCTCTYLLKDEGSFVVPHVLPSGVRLALQVLSKVRKGMNIGETS